MDSMLCNDAKAVLNAKSNEVISLSGLEATLLKDLVCQMLNVDMIPQQLFRIIEEKSNGVPLWCQQLVNDLLDSNVIQVVMKSTVEMVDFKEGSSEANFLEAIWRNSEYSSIQCVARSLIKYVLCNKWWQIYIDAFGDTIGTGYLGQLLILKGFENCL